MIINLQPDSKEDDLERARRLAREYNRDIEIDELRRENEALRHEIEKLKKKKSVSTEYTTH